MEENWRCILGWEGKYEASDLGRIRSLGVRGKVLRPQLFNNGYLIVWLCRDAKQYARTVHSLVAEAFLGPRPPGLQVNHKDMNRQNPSLENLEYLTPLENNRHAFKNGGPRRRPEGPKLKADHVAYIRSSGLPIELLGDMFDVTWEHISRVKRGVNGIWVDKSHVPDADFVSWAETRRGEVVQSWFSAFPLGCPVRWNRNTRNSDRGQTGVVVAHVPPGIKVTDAYLPLHGTGGWKSHFQDESSRYRLLVDTMKPVRCWGSRFYTPTIKNVTLEGEIREVAQ